MKSTARKSLAAVLALLLLLGTLSVGAFASNTGYEPLRIHCTFYGDSKTQRGFNWFTAKDCDSVVQVVKAANYGGSFDNAVEYTGSSEGFQDYTSHKVVVTGLTKGTTYYYRVGSADNNIWSAAGKFVTDNGDGKFSFLAIADVQASSLENFQKAAVVMDKARATDKNAEFYINLGDFVNDCTNDEWNWYGQTFEKTNTNLTLAPVAGNHEGNPTNKLNPGWFEKTFCLQKGENSLTVNGVYYSFDYGNAHFTVLNSNDMYPMTQQQRNWCVNDIKQSNARWKILLLHRAAYSAGKNINKPDTIAMRDTIIGIVDETNVDIVFSGHDHMYMRTKQVKGDAPVEVTYKDMSFGGKTYTFAQNPDGAVYILPSTAGTKRYTVNDNPIDPIRECAEKTESTRDLGGCFADVKIDGSKLVYTAYTVNDETGKVTKLDEYAIYKSKNSPDQSDDHLEATDIIGSLDGSVSNTFFEILKLIITYLTKLLPQTIKGLF